MLKVDKLCVTYGDGTSAVSQLSFSVSRGENVALIGANGAGKTSLLLSLVGVVPSSGEVNVDGVILSRKTLEQVRQRIGVVFQNPDDQLFMPTVYEDIAFGPRNYGMSPDEVKKLVKEVADRLDISHLLQKSGMRLSGGEKRMAAIATVLSMNPSVILMDEPTAFLDPKARQKLITLLQSLPHTKIIATHDMPFAEDVCNRVMLVKKGSIIADGESKRLLSDKDSMERCGVSG